MTYIQMLDKVFNFGKDVPYEAKIEIYNIVIAYLMQTGKLNSVSSAKELETIFENLKNDIDFSTYIKTNKNEKVKKNLSFDKAVDIIKDWVKEPENLEYDSSFLKNFDQKSERQIRKEEEQARIDELNKDLEYDPSFIADFSHKGKEQIKQEEEQSKIDAYNKKINDTPVMMNSDGTIDVSGFSLSREPKTYSDSNGKRKFKLTKKQILAGTLATVMLFSALGVAIHHYNSNTNPSEIVTESKEEKMSFRYLIKKGDTIWDLGRRFSTNDIHDKDGNSLKNDSFINEGDTLMITVSSNDFNIYDLVKEAEEAYAEGKTFTSEEDFANIVLEESVKSK